MSQKIQVTMTCDLPHINEDNEEVDAPGHVTVSFAVGGKAYEMDLCDIHEKEFNETLNSYTARARKAKGSKRGAGAQFPQASARSTEGTEIRDWALKNGYEVSARGRISATVREAYEAAHTRAAA